MEVNIYIQKRTFDEMIQQFESFKDRIIVLCDKRQDKMMDDWLDNQEVCLLQNISPRTLQSYRDTGKIYFSQINHKIYYKSSDIEKFLKSDNKNLKQKQPMELITKKDKQITAFFQVLEGMAVTVE